MIFTRLQPKPPTPNRAAACQPARVFGQRPGQPARSRAGLSLVEIIIAAGIIAVLMLASAASMGETVESSNSAKRMTSGAVFIESVQEDLAALAPSGLLAMNGQVVYDLDDWQNAAFQCDITVFNVSTSLLQVELTLTDRSTGRPLASIHTLRAVV